MKSKILFTFISFLFFSTFGYSQYNDDDQSLGLPGDNLNLYATLKLFQESETLELFEKKLNDQESNINNLDLNGDNQIDYIRVIDNIDNNVHVITLQIAINRTENQDVAVIIVQNNNNNVQIQVIGDESLYGKNYIIEPNFADENGKLGSTPNPGYTGPKTTVVINNYTTSELYSWPVVRFIYAPAYRPWNSPWYWDYYPNYWHSWNPYYWHYYWGYHYHWHSYYSGHYRHGHQPRYTRLNDFYYGHRRANSTIVRTKIERRDYKSTYSRPDMAEKGSESFRVKYPNNPSSREKIPVLKASEKRDNSFKIDRKSDNYQRSNDIKINNENKINSRQNNDYKNIPENQNNSRKNNQNYSVPEKQNNTRPNNNQQPDSRINNSRIIRSEPKRMPESIKRSEPKQSQPVAPAKKENNKNVTPQTEKRR